MLFLSRTTKKYIYIFKISGIITLFSFVVEFIFPFIKNLHEIPHLVGVFIFRFIHFAVFIYFSTFIFFKGEPNMPLYAKEKPLHIKIDVVFYLFLVILMEISWKFYDFCPATYYELKMYEVNEKNYHTTFHPALFSIFRGYSDYIIYVTGFAMAVNVIYILYNEQWITIPIKIIYLFIFSYLLFSTIIQHRSNLFTFCMASL
jgi:hypothetical protein